MTIWLLETTSEEVQGNRHTVTIGVKARAFRKNGSLRVIPPGFGATGDAQLPHGREGLLLTRMADRLTPGQNPNIHIGKGQHHIRMSALGTKNVAGAAVYDGLGNVIGRRFNGAYTGADLEWLDLGHGVLEYFHLKPGHPQVFEVRIDDHSGRLVPSARGWDLLPDRGDTPVLFATPGYLFKPDDPTAATIPVTTTVRTQGGKSIYRYVLPAPPDGQPDWAGWTLDPSWESQPGAAAGEDTLIDGRSGATGRNFGLTTAIYVGCATETLPFRSLLRFTLSLAGSPTSAILTLQRTAGADTTARDVSFNRALRQWWEGVKDSAAPDAGQDGSTWALRNANGAVAWGAAGGQSGTDYAATATATTSVTGDGAYTWDVTDDVIAWHAGTANWGWFGFSVENLNVYKAFASSDGLTADQRPKLTVVTVASSGGRPRWWLVHRP